MYFISERDAIFIGQYDFNSNTYSFYITSMQTFQKQ